jgi:putative transposase
LSHKEIIFIELIDSLYPESRRDEIKTKYDKKIMANTFTRIYLQFVFAVQDWVSLTSSAWKDELYKYITGIVQNNNHKLMAINGMTDHLYVFMGYKPHQFIPDLLQDIKGSSSGWINSRNMVKGKFRRQEGYGAFSYSHSHIDNVIKYIMNQELHHHKRTFTEKKRKFYFALFFAQQFLDSLINSFN